MWRGVVLVVREGLRVERRSLHPQRIEDLRLDVLVEGAVGGRLDRVRQKRIRGVVVLKSSTGMLVTLASGRSQEVIQVVTITQGNAGLAEIREPCEKHLGRPQVRQTGAVGEQFLDRDFGRTLELHRRVPGDRIIEGEHAAFDLLEHGERGERLGDRGNAVKRIGRRGRVRVEIPRPEPRRVPFGRPVGDNQARAGCAGLGEPVVDEVVDSVGLVCGEHTPAGERNVKSVVRAGSPGLRNGPIQLRAPQTGFTPDTV